MTLQISERAFEEEIECALLRHGPDACPDDAAAVRESGPEFGDEPPPGGYLRRRPEDYDRALCLIPTDVVDFLRFPGTRTATLLVAGAGWGRCTIEAALLRDGLDAARGGARVAAGVCRRAGP